VDETSGDAKDYGAGFKLAVDLVCEAVEALQQQIGAPQELGDRALFELARWVKMTPDGRAAKFLDHFLRGAGSDIVFDCATLLKEDAGVRRRVQSEIDRRLKLHPGLAERKLSGGDFLIPIRQKDYEVQDWCYALGSFAIEWEVIQEPELHTRAAQCSSKTGHDWLDSGTMMLSRSRPPGILKPSRLPPSKVKVYGANEYKWHPAAPRVTQCIHQAGDRLTRSNLLHASNYWMIASPCLMDLRTGLPDPKRVSGTVPKVPRGRVEANSH
jgi:hypothetical protein